MSEFKYTQRVEGGKLILALEGAIDEDVSFPSVDTSTHKAVELDLKSIKTINSVGIREWLNWIRPIAESAELILSNCPKALVFQFNMVEGFLPARAKVVSFYVPFFCEECDREENLLFTLGQDIVVKDGQPVVIADLGNRTKCDSGRCALEMDVTEAKYFQFVRKLAA